MIVRTGAAIEGVPQGVADYSNVESLLPQMFKDSLGSLCKGLHSDPQPSHDIEKLFGCLLNTKPPLKDIRRVTLGRPDRTVAFSSNLVCNATDSCLTTVNCCERQLSDFRYFRIRP